MGCSGGVRFANRSLDQGKWIGAIVQPVPVQWQALQAPPVEAGACAVD
jgi:hypothetical protein